MHSCLCDLLCIMLFVFQSNVKQPECLDIAGFGLLINNIDI